MGMVRTPSRLTKIIIVLIVVTYFVLLFRPVILGNKTLFPSNLLVSAYAPWKYEPVPEYPNGPANKPVGFDDIRQFFPNRKLLSESLRSRSIPLWNPYIYSGTPFMAAFDTAVWYPISWIAVLLPAVDGWNFLVLIQPVLSLLFMYLFLRSLKFGLYSAVFGAFVYAFSGWMVVYWQEILVLEHSFLWLPLALFASNRLWVRHNDTLGFLLLVAALACSVFGGFLQMSVYVYGVVIAWNVFCYIVNRRNLSSSSSAKIIIAGISISVFIACIQLIPSIEAYVMSPRGISDGSDIFSNYLLPLRHLITFLVPDFWGNPGAYNYFGNNGFYFEKMIFFGIIPLIFTLYALFTDRTHYSMFWKVLGIVALSMGFSIPTSWWPRLLSVPVLSNSYPTRIISVSTFAFAVLSTYGLESFIQKPKRRIFTWILVVLTAVMAATWIFVLGAWLVTYRYPWVINICEKFIVICYITKLYAMRHVSALYATVSFRNLFLPSLFILSGWLILFVSKYRIKAVYIISGAIVVFSSYYFTQKYLFFSDRRFVYPTLPIISELSKLSGYDRVWGVRQCIYRKEFTPVLSVVFFRWVR